MKFDNPPQKKNNNEKSDIVKKIAQKTVLGLSLIGAGFSASGKGVDTAEKRLGDEDSTKNERRTIVGDAKKIEGQINKTSERVEIKIANYFETDKAEISKENASEISKLISAYISNLNEGNVDQFINSAPQLNVSCDPRSTTSFENGNLGLAKARANEAQKTIKGIVSSFDFSKSGLTPDQVKKVIEEFSNLNFNIPPDGVVDYHAVATEAEWGEAKADEAKRLEIYKKMRFVNLELVVVNKEKPVIKVETGGGFFNVEKYSEAFLFIDQSPSMKESRTVEKIIKQLSEKKQKDIPTHVVGYTNKINSEFTANNLIEGAEEIKKMEFVNEKKEETIAVLIKLLEKQDRKESIRVAYPISDEKVQNVSKDNLDKLKKLSTDKNIDLIFILNLDGHEFQISIEELEVVFNREYKKEIIEKRIADSNERIKQLKKFLAQQKADLKGPMNKNDRKKLEQSITDAEALIVINEDNIKKLSLGQIDIGYDDLVRFEKKGNTANYADGFVSTSK